MKNGMAISRYSFNKNMTTEGSKMAMYTADSDMLIVPCTGTLHITTEMGRMTVAKKEICVIQRGIKFSVDREDEGVASGWICETYKGHFVVPDLGPIGSNGLANDRDFLTPQASYEDTTDAWSIFVRFNSTSWKYSQDYSPFNVVAWHGNYAPYKYDLNKFATIGSISFDHPDPSIFTVLTCQTDDPGCAVVDFVIFPPRWLVAEDTFRPPWYHRNCMSEFMGNISGTYDAKEKGFIPGASSLHSCMSGHGPEAEVFDKASNADLKPMKTGADSLAFMFETNFMLKLTKEAIEGDDRDEDYQKCWDSLPNNFTATQT